MNPILVQINISSSGGMPKLPVGEAMVTADGVAGDWQRNRKFHGGPNRAICIYSEELYSWLRKQKIQVYNGQIGENFTTRGLDLLNVSTGDRFRVGSCVIELASIRIPCANLNQWDDRLLKTIQGRSGWLAKVIEPGIVRPGDLISPLKTSSP